MSDFSGKAGEIVGWIIGIPLAAVLVTSPVWGLMVLGATWNYYLTYGYEVVVKDGTTVLFDGSAACVKYETAGNRTTVRIMKPFFWCSVFQEREYVVDSLTVTTK